MTTLPFNDQVFVDTNILYYADTPTDPLGKQALLRLQTLNDQNNRLFISPQVLREYANVCFRNALYHRMDMKTVIETVTHNLACFHRDFIVLYENETCVRLWLESLSLLSSSKDIFDFDLVATMQAYGISYVLTHNTNDFAPFSSWLKCISLFD
jgi:predicted nucleic acid-binding protein